MDSVPTQSLPSGDEIPVVGAGTWDISGDAVNESVETALEVGYTHIDTAEGYKNEAEIGEVLAEHDREDVFLTSKVLPSNLHYDDVFESLEASLEKLGTSYLDLYLIHWPNPAISLRETFNALERAHEEGLIRNVGVSNFSRYQLMFAQQVADVPIAVNQIELHPWYYREELLEYCQENDIVVEAAAPLARTELFDDPVLNDIADSYEKTPAQVALKWALQKDVVVVPKSTSAEHLRQNLELFEWELEADDVGRIDEIDRMDNVYMIDLDDDTYGIPP
ncbi:aldo/keto reductase (plasmid) [Haloterrigena turkmenica DSM 5511]|uniref:Aldo/keto reductase n=1 Tax=Haloterrigena turkmenica (strain ATCC 51198 / DSM 5511 / JCM 9101 / NCIMB 13204 / VKM B-1734 / 4k) TaxID=543526 RepID=D2S0D6_HALTV|nr:aldo/keto reductase [Haloterrigena turkmenica]ADB62833.1 aldo/keto reductase [Haloterrigena turkmenica DSM 5511]